MARSRSRSVSRSQRSSSKKSVAGTTATATTSGSTVYHDDTMNVPGTIPRTIPHSFSFGAHSVGNGSYAMGPYSPAPSPRTIQQSHSFGYPMQPYPYPNHQHQQYPPGMGPTQPVFDPERPPLRPQVVEEEPLQEASNVAPAPPSQEPQKLSRKERRQQRRELRKVEQEKKRQAQKQKRCCTTTRVFTYCVCCVCVSVLGFVAAAYTVYRMDDDSPKPAATCGSCHCILDDQVTSCPTENIPPASYAEDMIETFAAQTLLNGYGPRSLKCDAFDDYGCELEPPQPDLGDDAVCGIHYENSTCEEYKLKSYESRQEAEDQGAFVTHAGECGVCSSTQDLSVYLKHIDLTTLGEGCGAKAMTNFWRGQECFQELGFTEDCSKLWADNARKTGWNCGMTCLVGDILDKDFNGPPPTCALNDCLSCDEKESGLIFRKFAGRTRRSAGLLSAIARPCSEIADIRHTTTCPVTTPLVE